MERTWPSLSQRQLIQETLAGPRRLAAAADGVLNEDEVKLLLREPTSVERAPWTRSDVPLLHEADFLVSGRIERFGHVILDEAQDLTPMEILMVGRKTSGSLTIFGDLAQATGSWQYESWEELKAQLPDDRSVELVTLELSYRVPSQILTLAARLPEIYLPELPQPRAVREGEENPRTIEASRGDLPLQACAEAADLEAKGGSVGVIAPPSLLRSVLGAATSVGLSVTDVEREDGIGSGISILTPADAKGLEFDHAVVVAPAQIMLAEDTGPAELFVAMTRPTRSLTLIHDGALPDVLGGTVPVPRPKPPSDADVPAPREPEEPGPESASLPGSRFVEAVVVGRLIASGRDKPSEEFAGALAAAAASIRSGEPEDVVIEAMLLALDADLDSEPLLRALRK